MKIQFLRFRGRLVKREYLKRKQEIGNQKFEIGKYS